MRHRLLGSFLMKMLFSMIRRQQKGNVGDTVAPLVSFNVFPAPSSLHCTVLFSPHWLSPLTLDPGADRSPG